MFTLQPKPQIGQTITIDGARYRIIDVPYYGTIIVESLDRKRRFRLDGQAWTVER